MNTDTNNDDIQKSLEDLFKPRSEDVETKHDSLMLMAAFLSEIEYVQEQKKVSRKELASMIKTSGSYLTQVFRSKKPLNFLTLAKIKRALNIGFEVKVYHKNIPDELNINVPVYQQIPTRGFAQQFLSEINDTSPVIGSKFFTTEGEYNSTSPQTIKKSNPILS